MRLPWDSTATKSAHLSLFQLPQPKATKLLGAAISQTTYLAPLPWYHLVQRYLTYPAATERSVLEVPVKVPPTHALPPQFDSNYLRSTYKQTQRRCPTDWTDLARVFYGVSAHESDFKAIVRQSWKPMDLWPIYLGR